MLKEFQRFLRWRCYEVNLILTGRLLHGPKPTDHDLFHCDGAATSAVRLLSFVPPYGYKQKYQLDLHTKKDPFQPAYLPPKILKAKPKYYPCAPKPQYTAFMKELRGNNINAFYLNRIDPGNENKVLMVYFIF